MTRRRSSVNRRNRRRSFFLIIDLLALCRLSFQHCLVYFDTFGTSQNINTIVQILLLPYHFNFRIWCQFFPIVFGSLSSLIVNSITMLFVLGMHITPTFIDRVVLLERPSLWNQIFLNKRKNSIRPYSFTEFVLSCQLVKYGNLLVKAHNSTIKRNYVKK